MFDGYTTGDTAHIDTLFKFLPHTRLHRHPVSVNCLYHACVVLSVGRSFAYFARNARCTVTTDLLCDIPTHKTTSPPERPFFSLHTLAQSSGRNVNYVEKQLTGEKFLSYSFYLYRFRKYMSYGFPIINFCNSAIHYETPCASVNMLST